MSDDSKKLLVPISLEVLLVNNDEKSQAYANRSPHYELLNGGMVLGDCMTCDPLTTTSNLKPGAHLHWALPDALTHGVQDENGETYPAVPNRWFVLRIHTDYLAAGPQTSLKGWIIESDYLYYQRFLEDDKDWKQNQDSIVIPTALPGSTPPKYWGRYLGRRGEYGKPLRSYASQRYLDKLTAIGPGDPLFAASYPNCKSVFGFHDKLDDIGAGTLAYLVAGWYAEPKQDPLYGKKKDDWCVSDDGKYLYLDALKWSIPGNPDAFPAQLLCHSLAYNIVWKGPKAVYPSGAPQGDMDLAVGNTSVEALSALIASKLGGNKNIARVMEAIQYELLSLLAHPDGFAQLDEEIHQKSFKTKSGECTWVIRKKDEKELEGTQHPSAFEPFPGTLGDSLNDLNVNQRKLNRSQRELKSLQWETYSTWYKYISQRESPKEKKDPSRYEKRINDLCSQIDEKKKEIDTLGDAVATRADKLRNEDIDKTLPSHTLSAICSSRYWEANEPVVLLSGSNVARAFKHGFNDRFYEDGFLHCRLTGQTIQGLSITIDDKKAEATPRDIQGFYREFLKGDYPLPSEIQDLFIESFFIDKNQGTAIALALYKKIGIANPTKNQIEGLSTQIREIQASGISEFQGIVPSQIAAEEWKTPWSPLFLEWQVQYFPGVLTPDQALADWKLHDIDYGFTAEKMPDEWSIFQGAILLTPHAPIQLKNSLQKYFGDHQSGDNADELVREIIKQFDNLNILSQALSGFNESLLMQKQTLQLPVFDKPEKGSRPGNPELAQKVKDHIDEMNHISPVPVSRFYPIRAGFLKIMKLWIVDAFGQIQEIRIPSRLICSESLNTDTAQLSDRFILPPRVTQPSRLLFRWLSAKNPLQETNSDPATSPICGWVMPNHLDNSIMIYDADGILLGSLQSFFRGDEKADIHWMEAPGVNTEPDSFSKMEEKIKNAELRQLVLTILEKGIQAFQGLLDTIDETWWNIDPLGERKDPSLSVLSGRPLALARAYLQLELEGLPAYHQHGDYLDKPDTMKTDGFDRVAFPVHLGNVGKLSDGLIGYFINSGKETYRVFYPTHGAPDTQKDNPYISYENKLKLTCAGNGSGIAVTLLIDPRAGVHATTGILPVKYIDIPNEHVSKALTNMNVIFSIQPILCRSIEKTSAGTKADAEENVTDFSMPVPSTDAGEWSWIYKSSVAEWGKPISDIKKATQNAQFSPGPRQIYEGWLRLMNAQSRDIVKSS